LHASFERIRDDKNKTEAERESLENRKAEELQLKTIQEMERKRIAEREAEKKKILAETKGLEKTYKTLKDDRAKTAAQIRAALFTLNGSAAIPFEKALQYALLVEQQVGIRPAFLLGIIAEESNLGQNVGTGNWKDDLSHPRCEKQRVAFVDITSRLGLNPDAMPVSKRAWYGYCGGAMGPAQFIPTTWQLYEAKVASLTGNNPPNPWNPLDAFMASGLLLRDNGAGGRTYKAEHTAALKYLAGGNWNTPSYRFYGDDVMALAQKYQDQINVLNGVASR
jgi:membrane-bound lytic murein transglycosylase B